MEPPDIVEGRRRGHVRLHGDGAGPGAPVATGRVGVQLNEKHPVDVRGDSEVCGVRPQHRPGGVLCHIAHLDPAVGGGAVGRVQEAAHVRLAGLVEDAVTVCVAVAHEDVAVGPRGEAGLPLERPPCRRPHEHMAAVPEEDTLKCVVGGERHLGVAAHAHGGVLGTARLRPGEEHLTPPPLIRHEGDPAVSVERGVTGVRTGVVAVSPGPPPGGGAGPV